MILDYSILIQNYYKILMHLDTFYNFFTKDKSYF